MMESKSARRLVWGALILSCASALAPAAQARDFFSALFGGFGGGRSRQPYISLPFSNDGGSIAGPVERPRYGGGQAYCVRSCDGRYFPLTAPDNASRVATCNSFCPAS